MDTSPARIEPVLPKSQENPHPSLSLSAFVGYLAALMAINALATDIMLPAFPDIGHSLGADTTSVQAIITAYMIGFGLSQLGIGFVTDRYGRRPILLAGLLIFTVGSIFCVTAQSLAMLLIFRVLQGLGAGGVRIVVVAAARDCYHGRRLARVMSLVMTIFMIAPVLAPTVGQGILLVTSWHAIFGFLVVYGLVMLFLCWRFFPETLDSSKYRAIQLPLILGALASVFRSQQTVGYTVAAGVFFGSVFGFIASAEQLLGQTYGLGVWFPLIFAVMALFLSAASFVNSMLVERFGMRLLSHSAVVLFCVNNLVMTVFAVAGTLTIWRFVGLHSLNMLVVGLIFANFNTIALEPQGHIAGVASAFISAVTVLIGALMGYFIGHAYNGTPIPLAVGFLVSGVACLIVLLVTEKGRLFQGQNT